jgi:hypothetical protein
MDTRGFGQAARQSPAGAHVDHRPQSIARTGLAAGIHNSPYVAAQRLRIAGMFGPAAQPKDGSHGVVIQCAWKTSVAGPDPFDPDDAVAKADWSNPKYVSVNISAEQGTNPNVKSYRMTAWAPAIVGDWEVTVAAHSYFEAHRTRKQVRRTKFGHLYINDWEGFSTEDDTIRATVYGGLLTKLVAKMGDVTTLKGGSSVDITGAYDRASFRPRKIT